MQHGWGSLPIHHEGSREWSAMNELEKNLYQLEKHLNDLKSEVKRKKLSRSDRLLLDILSKIVDIFISGFEEKLSQKLKRRTSNPLNQKEIRNEKAQKVLSLSEFLRTRGRPSRRK